MLHVLCSIKIKVSLHCATHDSTLEFARKFDYAKETKGSEKFKLI